jgi:L-fucose isomerase-like protein
LCTSCLIVIVLSFVTVSRTGNCPTDSSAVVTFQVLTAASMKVTVFSDVALCSLEVDRRFRGEYYLDVMITSP